MGNRSIKLSIIISTSSISETLQSCLEGLEHNPEPTPDIEVILVTDGEIEALKEKQIRIHLLNNLKILRHIGPNEAAAWNYGAKSASGTYLLFLKDSFQPDPDLAAAHLRAQEKYGGVIGLGSTQCGSRPDGYGLADTIVEKRNGETSGLKQAIGLFSFTQFSGNLSVPRRPFIDAGGFDLDVPGYEISELCYRLELQGLPFAFISNADGTETLINFIFALWFGDTRVISNLFMKQKSDPSSSFYGKNSEHHGSSSHP